MRISLNEIKKLVPAAAKVETAELVRLIGSRLVEVEETIDLAPKYQNIYIVKVVECEPIEGTHLHLCQIDAGQAVPVQVVCGAPNVHAGMLAVWVAPGAIVPQTYGEEDFKLDVRKLRGFESHGMLAAIDELDLGDDHEGIAEIDPSTDNPVTGQNVQPGDNFADVFDLNDTILDIENKSLTHRPDCFGLIGFAREVAGILGEPFQYDTSEAEQDKGQQVHIEIADPSICPRYSCAVLELKDADKSDKYLTATDIFLAKAGMRGISKIVDVTNYLMLMTGQPLHAFDYDKFLTVGGKDTATIGVRLARLGEKLQLLDGKTIDCIASDILITSGDTPVALAGAMGGASTEIDVSTTRVLLESATFSLYNLRKTQMAHGIFSEAITRFTKGQPACQTKSVLDSAIVMLGGTVVATGDNYAKKSTPAAITVTATEINSLLGTNYDAALMSKTLTNVGFEVIIKPRGDAAGGTPSARSRQASTMGESAAAGPVGFTITPPTWRTDIHIKEDIIEEIGRLLGYDNIPLTYPTRPFIGARVPELLQLKNKIRDIMSGRLAAHEVLTYTFVSEKLQQDVGEDATDSYKIVNSISPELQCFRQTITPSLLEKVRGNLKSGHRDFALYEINQVTKQSYGKDEDGVPKLYTHLAYVTTGDFYQMKAALVALLEDLGFDADKLDFRTSDGHLPYLEPLRSTSVTTPHLCAGEVRNSVKKRLKLGAEPISAFEISLEQLLADLSESSKKSVKLSKFPAVTRDITLKVPAETPFVAAKQAITEVFERESLIIALTPNSIFEATKGAKYRNLSFHLEFKSAKKTLESQEISDIMEKVAENAKKSVGAEII